MRHEMSLHILEKA